jgi:hypothetical protein
MSEPTVTPKTRIEALADLEQLAAIALECMVPTSRRLAIAHLRADLLALGVTEDELAAAGITDESCGP